MEYVRFESVMTCNHNEAATNIKINIRDYKWAESNDLGKGYDSRK